MIALFLAMALNPEVQEKAHAEIDAVIGPDRLPDFEDRPSLPYINAIVKEVMRWHQVAPLGDYHLIIIPVTLSCLLVPGRSSPCGYQRRRI